MRNINPYKNSGKLTFTPAGSQTVTWEMTPVTKTPRKKNNSEHSKFSINTSNPVIFEIDRDPLGKGSYGTTKKAKKINSEDSSYVIKKFRVNLGNQNLADRDAEKQLLSALNEYEYLRKIKREAYLFHLDHGKAKKTKDNSNLDTGDESYTHTVYLIMPYLGKSLLNFLNENQNTVTFDQKLNLAIQLIDIVIKLHETHKISHYDIKPANITIDSKNQLHLIDFGMSTAYSQKKNPFQNPSGYAYWPARGKVSPAELDRFSVFRSIYGADTTKKHSALSIFTEEDLNDHPDLKNLLDTSNNAVPKPSLTQLRTALTTKLQNNNPSLNTNSETIKEASVISPHLYRGIQLCLVSAAIFTLAFSGILPAAVASLVTLMLIVKILAAALALFGVMNLSAGALASTPCCRA